MDNIICDNCIIGIKTIDSNSIDMTLTSPPYDNLREYNNKSKWDMDTFNILSHELYRVTMEGGIVVWNVNDATINGSETGTSFRHALGFMDAGFKLNDTMIWDKNNVVYSGKDRPRYNGVFEYMFILSKGKPKTFHPIKDKHNRYAGCKVSEGMERDQHDKLRTRASAGKGKRIADYSIRSNIWVCSVGYNKTTKDKYAYAHPALMPERLAKDLIISWSNVGDIVFDPFMGAGTTAKCAIELGRHYIGCEINQDYISIAQRRIEDAKRSIL